MTGTPASLQAEYRAALADHLAGAGEAALQRAYELGRRAISQGVGVLDLAGLHHQALVAVLQRAATPAEQARALAQAEAFFVESLSPFDMASRAFQDAVTALRRVNDTFEEEAKRIAHALHDEAGQLLASVYLALEEISRDLPAARGRLQEVRKLLDGIEDELRRLSHELRPTILDDLGLAPALEFLAEGVSARSGLAVTVEAPKDRRLPPAIETALYRTVKEALTNVTRHAQASRVRVEVGRRTRAIFCSVRDDGKGFDIAEVLSRKGGRGFGLAGIGERLRALGGTLDINSAPGKGTELVITIPVES